MLICTSRTDEVRPTSPNFCDLRGVVGRHLERRASMEPYFLAKRAHRALECSAGEKTFVSREQSLYDAGGIVVRGFKTSKARFSAATTMMVPIVRSMPMPKALFNSPANTSRSPMRRTATITAG